MSDQNQTLMWAASESDPSGNGTNEYVSLKLRNVLLQVNCIILLLLGVTGIPTNVLNMLIFHKMGLGRGTNISFFALSAADLVCGCIYVFLAVVMMGQSRLLDLGVDISDFRYLFGPIILSVSAFISWVTTIISVERCFCVLLPQRTKDIFSEKTTLSLIAGMLLVQVSVIIASVVSKRLTITRSTLNNQSHVRLDHSTIDSSVFVSLNFWAASLPTFICLLIVVCSTGFLLVALTKRGKWLQSLPSSGNNAIKKNKKLMYVVVAISVIHIICFLPGVITIFVSFAVTDFNPFEPRSKNLYLVLSSFVGEFQALSSVVNMFVYLRMSSNYNQCWRNLLHLPSRRVFPA